MAPIKAEATIAIGSWGSGIMEHPAMPWFKSYTEAYDAGEAMKNFDQWHTSDWQYANSKGQVFEGGKESRENVTQDYSFFTKYRHEPYQLAIWETSEGYVLDGDAWLYCNLPSGSDTPLTDENGNKWEMRVPGGFHFKIVKDGSSYKLKSTSVTSDSGPVVLELLKRGVITPAALGL